MKTTLSPALEKIHQANLETQRRAAARRDSEFRHEALDLPKPEKAGRGFWSKLWRLLTDWR